MRAFFLMIAALAFLAVVAAIWPALAAEPEPAAGCRTVDQAIALADEIARRHGVDAVWHYAPFPDGAGMLTIRIIGAAEPLIFHFGADGCLIREKPPPPGRPPVNGTPA